jgi:threonine/homoserine/homoserine lactone efflux protein
MPDASRLLLFLVSGLALNVTPGPDMLYVIARSVGEGKRAGVVSALGISVGSLFHMVLVAFGAAAVLAARPGLFRAVQYAGAAYLIYLGARALMTAKHGLAAPNVRPASLSRIFRQGVITNILNPKVILFFFAFLPQFADPSAGPVALQVIVLGLIFNTTGTAVNVLVAVGAGGLADRLRSRASVRLRQLTGLVFIGLGLRLALTRNG